MEELRAYPGKHQNSVKYYENGYTYYADSRNALILRCSLRAKVNLNERCKGSIYLEEDGTIEGRLEHNHRPDFLIIREEEFKEEIFRRCRTTFDTFTDIFNAVGREERFRDVRARYNCENLKSQMKRARRENVPVTPPTLFEMSQTLNTYVPVDGIFRGSIQTENDGCALLFIHPSMEDPLRRCTQLYADGTFKILPHLPRDIAQIYTVHFRKLDTGFPAIFVLMSRRTSVLYKAMWERIIVLIPELRNINSLMLDYERAAVNAAREVFPNARISGCLFHYKQAIIKYWCNTLRMQRDEHVDILETALALPYLPHNLIRDGINVLTTIVDAIEDDRLQRFMRYIRRIWLPLAEVMSVFGLAVKTTNVCELFHKNIHKRFHNHPQFFHFIELMIEIMEDTGANYDRVEGGQTLRSKRKAEEIQNDVALLNLQAQVVVGRISVEEFLRSIMLQRRLKYGPPIPFEDQRVALGLLPNDEEEFELFIQDIQRVFVRDPGPGNDFENERNDDRRIRQERIRAAMQIPHNLDDNVPLAEIVGQRRFVGRRNRRVRANAHHQQEIIGRVQEEVNEEHEGHENEEEERIQQNAPRQLRLVRRRQRQGRNLVNEEEVNEVNEEEEEHEGQENEEEVNEEEEEHEGQENEEVNEEEEEHEVQENEERLQQIALRQLRLLRRRQIRERDLINEENIEREEEEEEVNEEEVNEEEEHEVQENEEEVNEEEEHEGQENEEERLQQNALRQLRLLRIRQRLERDLINEENIERVEEEEGVNEEERIQERINDNAVQHHVEQIRNNNGSNEANRHRRRRKRRHNDTAAQSNQLSENNSRNKRKKLKKKLKKEKLERQNAQLLQNVKTLQDDREEQMLLSCIICNFKKPSYMFNECKHICLCENCVERYTTYDDYVDENTGKVRCPNCNTYGFIDRVFISHS